MFAQSGWLSPRQKPTFGVKPAFSMAARFSHIYGVRTTQLKQSNKLPVAKNKNYWYSEYMDTTRRAHFELNRAPETATAVASTAVRDSRFSFYYYSYACQAMLEVRWSGE